MQLTVSSERHAYKQVTLEEQTRSYEYADMLHNEWIIVPSNNRHGTVLFYSLAPTSFILLILCSVVAAVFFLTISSALCFGAGIAQS